MCRNSKIDSCRSWSDGIATVVNADVSSDFCNYCKKMLESKMTCISETVGWMLHAVLIYHHARNPYNYASTPLCWFLRVCMCVWVTDVGCPQGGTRLVMCDLCTLYCVCVITSGCNQGAVAEVDAVGQQQLKWTQTGSSSWSSRDQGVVAEGDANGPTGDSCVATD